MNHILITGGTGYIGSHAVTQLSLANYHPIILDNLCNSDESALNAICFVTNSNIPFYKGDVRDPNCLREIFTKYKISAVIHFAGLKAVGESQQFPINYYDTNVNGTLNLLNIMSEFGVKKFVFSSSATVYGNPKTNCYTEDLPLSPINVYGKTKATVEQILNDLYLSDSSWSIANLRYFNPVGAHASGLIGENPKGTPNNLMPFMVKVATGQIPYLSVFGNDYPTTDGTGMRDYIHVEDLAAGHVVALEKIFQRNQLLTVNLGTGKPYSVLEMIHCFEKVSGKKIPHQFAPRREGDLPCYYANPELAKKLLDWSAKHDLERMCTDVWRFASTRTTR